MSSSAWNAAISLTCEEVNPISNTQAAAQRIESRCTTHQTLPGKDQVDTVQFRCGLQQNILALNRQQVCHTRPQCHWLRAELLSQAQPGRRTGTEFLTSTPLGTILTFRCTRGRKKPR